MNKAAPKSVASPTPAAMAAPAPIRASDASTAESHTGSHGGGGAGKPPVHPDSTPSGTPTSAQGGADSVGMGQFDTSKLASAANGHGNDGGGGDGNNSVGSAYRPGYSSGASTPTESIDGSNHRGGGGVGGGRIPSSFSIVAASSDWIR